MANPNIVNVTTIAGKTAVANVSTTATAIVQNSAASGKILKINTLIISNIDGSVSADASVDIFRNSVSYSIIKTVPIPTDTSLSVIDKQGTIYLEEGDQIRVAASANSDLQVVCSYEEIS